MCYFVKAGAQVISSHLKAKGAGESIATEGPAAGAAAMLILRH